MDFNTHSNNVVTGYNPLCLCLHTHSYKHSKLLMHYNVCCMLMIVESKLDIIVIEVDLFRAK